MLNNVTIGGKHLYRDFGLIMTSRIIAPAQVKKEVVDIPGADGQLDFSASLTGDIKYKNRKITINLVMTEKFSLWTVKISELSNYLHGKTFKIIFDDDIGFYWMGNVQINSFMSDKSVGRIVLECDVEPYKYDLNASNEDWLWDSFNFETGIINETKDLLVNGELEVNIYGRRKRVVPKIYCENELELVFNGETYNLPSGTSYVPNIEICEGINTLKFIGNGTVSIEYRGGSL